MTTVTVSKDFDRAGIPLLDADRRHADLHPLRTTLGTTLARAGIAPRLTQRTMRHGDYRTTLRHYTMLGLTDAGRAIAALPGVGGSVGSEAATGTHDTVPAGEQLRATAVAERGAPRALV